MTDAIKNRLDAIDAQMADLQKEQAKLREELDKPDFVPGWFIAWDGESLNDKGNTPTLFYFADQSEKEECEEAYENIAHFTPELAARFFPKTRYDWSNAPEWANCAVRNAPWADNANRACWLSDAYPVRLDEGNWGVNGRVKTISADEVLDDSGSWRDSLEARPGGM